MAGGTNLKISGNAAFSPVEGNKKTGVVFFSVSAVIHGLLILGMFFLPEYTPPKPMLSVVQVDLVSFAPEPVFEEPVKTPADSGQQEIPLKKSKLKKEPPPPQHIKPDISLKKKPKNLKELMAEKEKKEEPKKEPEPKPEKSTPEPEKKEAAPVEPEPENTPEDTEEKLADELEQRDQEQIAQALERLKENIKTRGESGAGGRQGGSSGSGRPGYKPIDLYHLVIGSAIEQNWVFNEALAGRDKNIEVRILIKILKSGEIRDIIYETRSGNRYLDDSAKKAIRKSNPLPPLPPGMYSYDVVLGFTPQGLK